jgi:hypothetical protein
MCAVKALTPEQLARANDARGVALVDLLLACVAARVLIADVMRGGAS